MKKIFAIISLAALMMPVSCMKDELAGTETGINASETMTFTALMEGAATKTVLDEQTGAVAWAAGDAIKFDYAIGKTDSNPVLSQPLSEADIKDGAASFEAEIPSEFALTDEEYAATFEEGVTVPGRYMYVAYPATVSTTYATAGTAYNVYIPSEQDGSFANASIALAKWDKLNPTAPLAFKNLCGLIQMTVDENVRQIKITSGDYIAGRANIGFNAENAPYVKNMVEAEASKTVTVNVEAAGTYYIAVAPGTIKDLYIELLGADGNAVCDKLAKGDVTVERAHILPLGGFADGSFAAAGGFFVKPTATGTGDGSSWDNAADYVGFYNLLDNTKTNSTAVTATVYMAAGTYAVNAQINVTPAHNVKIYGGYPSDAKGYSLTGRDVEANQTILDAGSNKKILNLTNGTWIIEGLTFQNAKATDGAVVLKNAISITFRNSVFKNNISTSTGGAAVFTTALTSQNVLFENCEFINNQANTTTNANTGLGGAVVAVGSATTLPTMTFNKCLFEKNYAALGGGAVCPRKANCRFVDCNFVDNTAESYGDDIYVENSNTVSVYCDGCNFFKTAAGYVKANTMIYNKNANASVGLNNCVVTGAWNVGERGLCINEGKTLTIANSTLFCQSGYPALLTQSNATTYVLNAIVLNAATSGTGRAIATNGSAYLYNAIYTKADEGGTEVTTTTTKTVLGETLKVVSGKNETFPVTPTWYGSSDSVGVMWGNKNSTSTTVDDCRGKYYYYAWDGVYPEGVEFTNATLTQVTQWVNAADAAFATWLGDSLGKDIRGVSRDADSMWPGSYQK